MQPRKITKEEKIVRLLDYLKKYTDPNNPASIPQIERYFAKQGYPNFFGNKNTRKSIICALSEAMNTDIHGELLPREEWRLVYDDFVKEKNGEKEEGSAHHIVNLYYNQVFSEEETRQLMHSIEKDADLPENDKKELLQKIRENLANDNFGKRPMTPAQRRARESGTKRSSYWINYGSSRKKRTRKKDQYY